MERGVAETPAGIDRRREAVITLRRDECFIFGVLVRMVFGFKRWVKCYGVQVWMG